MFILCSLTLIKVYKDRAIIFTSMNNLINTKVLIFDLETTGVPERKPGYHDGKNEYYDYKMNNKYDSSRIVSVAWCYIENFNKQSLTNMINNYETFECIRKPLDFKQIDNSDFHGITYQTACTKGITLGNIINKEGFGHAILNCDYIVGHNCLFDIFILLNELHRINFINCVKKLDMLLNTNKYVCTGELGKNICKILTKGKGYKMPRLNELYKHFYKKEPIVQHQAKDDVNTLLEIMNKIISDEVHDKIIESYLQYNKIIETNKNLIKPRIKIGKRYCPDVSTFLKNLPNNNKEILLKICPSINNISKMYYTKSDYPKWVYDNNAYSFYGNYIDIVMKHMICSKTNTEFKNTYSRYGDTSIENINNVFIGTNSLYYNTNLKICVKEKETKSILKHLYNISMYSQTDDQQDVLFQLNNEYSIIPENILINIEKFVDEYILPKNIVLTDVKLSASSMMKNDRCGICGIVDILTENSIIDIKCSKFDDKYMINNLLQIYMYKAMIYSIHQTEQFKRNNQIINIFNTLKTKNFTCPYTINKILFPIENLIIFNPILGGVYKVIDQTSNDFELILTMKKWNDEWK